MRSPLQREHLRFSTSLSPKQCRARLQTTTATGKNVLSRTRHPVRGWIGARRFYLEQNDPATPLLRTCLRGKLTATRDGAIVDVSLGAHPWVAVIFVALMSLLASAALVVTYLAWQQIEEALPTVFLSWSVVIALGGVLFLIPAWGHESERAFLLAHVRRTLGVRIVPPPSSRATRGDAFVSR